MSTEAINIVLNLSPDGTVLSFSVQKSEICKGLTKVEAESDLQDYCPTCTCRISVYTRPAIPELKTEPLFDEHDVSGKFLEEFHSSEDEKAIVELYFSADEEEKPNVDIFTQNAKENPDFNSPRSLSKITMNEVFCDEIALTDHQKRHGIVDGPSEPLPDAVKCPDHCNRYFANDEELQNHLENHLLMHGSVKCHKCRMELNDYKSYKEHMETHMISRTHICKICGATHESEMIHNLHMRWAHKKIRPCSFCGKIFDRWQSLLEHESHLCGDSFSGQDGLTSHREEHQKNVYICNFCGESHSSKRKVQEHIFSNHVKPEKPFVCPQCTKRFGTKDLFRVHLRRHTKPISCPTCKILFARQHELKAHINSMHTDLAHRERWKCKICGKILLRKYDLKAHMNTHKNVTEFKCRYCPKYLMTAYNLRVHEMIHTDEKPFTCQICGISFQESNILKIHIRRQCGEKPYECSLEEGKKRFSD